MKFTGVNIHIIAFNSLLQILAISPFQALLEDTARYAGLLLAPAEDFGLRPRLFLPFRQKRSLLCCFGPFLGGFWCPVVTLVTFSSNLSTFERNPKKKRKNPNKEGNPHV